MGTIFNIDRKLSATRNPILQIGDVELELKSNATDMLKVIEMMGNGDGIKSAEQIQEVSEIIFPESSLEKLDALGLTYKDRMTVLTCAIQIISNGELKEDEDDDDEGELDKPTLVTT